MPLVRQLLDIPFAAGQSEKTDPKQLQPPKLTAAVNADFSTVGKIKKRPQMQQVATLASGKGVLCEEFKNELTTLDGESLYSLAGSTFASKGALPVVNATTEPGARSPAVAVDSTEFGDWRIVVWLPKSGVALQYNIQHILTGQVLYSGPVASDLAVSAPRVVAFGAYFVVFYVSSLGPLNYVKITIPTTSVAPVVSNPVWADNTYGATDPFDVLVQGDRIYWTIFFNAEVTSYEIGLRYLDNSFARTVLLSPGSVPPDPYVGGTVALTALTLIKDWRLGGGTPGVIVVWGTSIDIWAQPVGYNGDGVSSFYYKKSNGGTGGAKYITGYALSASVTFPDVLFLVYATEEDDGVAAKKWTLRRLRFINFSHTTWATPTDGVLVDRVRPCARWLNYTDNAGSAGYIVPVIHESALQPTIFALRIVPDANWVTFSVQWLARYLPSLAGGYASNVSGIPVKWTQAYSVLSDSTGGKWAHICRVDTSNVGVDVLGFSISESVSAVEFANNLHVASGGMLWMYDGRNVVEHGFLLAPPIEERPFVGGVGSGDHTYAYQFVYAWTDARGQTHRSAPAPVVAATAGRPSLLQKLTADPIDSTHTVSMRIPSLVETAKSGIVIEVYRTADAASGGGTVYYLVGTVDNDSSGASVLFDDGMPDDYSSGDGKFLLEQPQLYTEGGVVQNDAAPTCSVVTRIRSRLWAIDASDPSVVWYSKALIPTQAGAVGVPAEWSLYFQAKPDGRGAPLTAIAGMDDKVVTFTADRMFYAVGDGPDDTGAGGSFTWYPLPFNVGSVGPAVVSTHLGLLFQSARGVYLLDRALQLQYIGADIETSALAATIEDGIAEPKSNRIQLLDSANTRILSFDHYVGQWSSWDLPYAPVSICQYGTDTYVLTTDGRLLKEATWGTPTIGDNGTYIPQDLTTGWVKIAGLQGFQRLRRILVLGDFKSAHVLNWQLWLDYNDTTPAQSGTLDVAAAMAAGGGYQLRIDLADQKCEAFKLRLWDSAGSHAIGEGMQLSGLTLEMGIKKGTHKLPAGQIVG